MGVLETLATRLSDQAASRAQGTVIAALDGRSGAGKSTLAADVGRLVDLTVIDGDDFYAGGTDAEWDSMDADEQVRTCIDWRRQRIVLHTLASGTSARWRPYDWDSFDGRLAVRECIAHPHPVVLLEGAYSCRPELADLLDLRVLLDTPEDVRRARLLRREGDAYRSEWEARWASAEDHYFGTVMPPTAFDLVLTP